jgi:hypothetical protein
VTRADLTLLRAAARADLHDAMQQHQEEMQQMIEALMADHPWPSGGHQEHGMHIKEPVLHFDFHQQSLGGGETFYHEGSRYSVPVVVESQGKFKKGEEEQKVDEDSKHSVIVATNPIAYASQLSDVIPLPRIFETSEKQRISEQSGLDCRFSGQYVEHCVSIYGVDVVVRKHKWRWKHMFAEEDAVAGRDEFQLEAGKSQTKLLRGSERFHAQRCFPLVALRGRALEELMVVTTKAPLGQEAEPQRRVTTGVKSGHKWVVQHLIKSISLQH